MARINYGYYQPPETVRYNIGNFPLNEIYLLILDFIGPTTDDRKKLGRNLSRAKNQGN